jgi:hypothetical protein
VGDVIVAGVLGWLVVCTWWGTEFAMRSGRREKTVGGFLIALGMVPALIALQLGT